MVAALELLDAPAEYAVDRVPTSDQEAPVASYRDWNPTDTRVVTVRIGNDLFREERFESRDEARAAIEQRHGRILEANYAPGRAFFRVMRRAS